MAYTKFWKGRLINSKQYYSKHVRCEGDGRRLIIVLIIQFVDFLENGKCLKINNLETNTLFATRFNFNRSWILQNNNFFRNWRRQKSRMERRHFRLLHFVSVAMPFIGWRRGGRAKLFLFSASSFREMRSLNNMGSHTWIIYLYHQTKFL